MGKQFADVSSRYGAPMGRSESPLGQGVRNVRLFRVRINGGGYDDGGAYWGIGKPLYCAQCDEGGQQFVRADGPLSAIVELQIECQSLKKPPRRQIALIRALAHGDNCTPKGKALLGSLSELGF